MRMYFTEVEEADRGTVERLAEGHEVKIFPDILNEDQLIEMCSEAEVLSPFIYTNITRKVIDATPDLKLITTRSTGFDHIDIAYAREKGIPVCNVPAYGMNTVAEQAFALLLSVIRHVPPSFDSVKAGKFSYEGYRGKDLRGRTLGVLGTGRIGVHAIMIGKGFGMDTIAYDIYHNEKARDEIGFDYVELDELFERSDAITIHLPLLDSTKHMINRDSIAQMKPGVIIVNTARGGIVDTDSLVHGLEAGIIGGLGLDVVEDELSMSSEHPLLQYDNVIITPHTAFYTDEAMTRIIQTTFDNIGAFTGGDPSNVVN